jgi:hypothetical protein
LIFAISLFSPFSASSFFLDFRQLLPLIISSADYIFAFIAISAFAAEASPGAAAAIAAYRR